MSIRHVFDHRSEPAERQPKSGSALPQDSALVLGVVEDVTGVPLPLTAMLMEMMQTLNAGGCGQNDHSGLAIYSAKLSGTNIGL